MSTVKILGSSTGTANFTVTVPSGTSTDRTLTLPDQTGTVLTNVGPFTANASASAGAVTIDASNNVGIGTGSPGTKLDVNPGSSGGSIRINNSANTNTAKLTAANSQSSIDLGEDGTGGFIEQIGAYPIRFYTNNTERARINSSGTFFVGKSTTALTTNGFYADGGGETGIAVSGLCLYVNRNGTDGTLVDFRQDNTSEGSISVSGTTVSYNGGHLSRWAQTIGPKDDTLVKGTVLSNLDEMNQYTDADGNPVTNEQLNKVKVSDIEGDPNVAGVFVNWSYDEQHNVDEINMAMTGDMIIRIAQGVAVQRGDLLMSAGDGTAKPQGDDIVRGKTVAKVTSTHITCTYADGSYCVPCVLMAC